MRYGCQCAVPGRAVAAQQASAIILFVVDRVFCLTWTADWPRLPTGGRQEIPRAPRWSPASRRDRLLIRGIRDLRHATALAGARAQLQPGGAASPVGVGRRTVAGPTAFPFGGQADHRRLLACRAGRARRSALPAARWCCCVMGAPGAHRIGVPKFVNDILSTGGRAVLAQVGAVRRDRDLHRPPVHAAGRAILRDDELMKRDWVVPPGAVGDMGPTSAQSVLKR